MTVRAVEWKQPYTWGTAIEITEDKVINLRLRAENNLIIYDEWDDEIYVDLQLPDEITPTDAFPVWITTGRVIVDNGWDVQGTIICAKTTSGDNIKILYADDGKLYMDNGTWSFKQIYFKADVDLITSSLQEQIDVLSWLGKFLSLWDCAWWEPMSFPLETPYTYSTWDYYLVWNVSSATPPVDYRPTWSEWDDVASQTAETEVVEIWDVYIYDWTVWLLQKNSASWGTGNVVWPNSATDGHIAVFNWATGKIIRDWGPIPTWDVWVSTDTGTLLSAWVDLWLGTETDFSSISTPDTNTLYIQYKSDYTPTDRPDITSAVYDNKSVSLNAGEPQGICFSTDWLNMYFCDFYVSTIKQYSLSTARDVSTATDTGNSYNVWYNVSWIAISENWEYLFIASWPIWIRKYTLSTPYDVSTASTTETLTVSGTNLTWLSINFDGTKLYYMDYSNQQIIEYSLPTARTLTWATLVGGLSYPVSWNTYRDCAVSSLWWKVLLVRQAGTSYIYQMNMSTENNITTATYNNINLTLSYNACGIYVKQDGSKMYVVDMNNKKVNQYSLS